MGLWTRMKRSMRALFGGIIEKTEDPELILQQTIRDMRDRVPELNNSVAQVMATENCSPRTRSGSKSRSSTSTRRSALQ
jgi:phage shock protein A